MQMAGGSLIVAIPCASGLIIAADRRVTDASGTDLGRDITKIGGLGTPNGVAGRAAFGIVGCPIIYDDRTPGAPFLWSASERIKDVDSVRGHDLEHATEFMEAVCLELTTSFANPAVQRDVEFSSEEALRSHRQSTFLSVTFWWLEPGQEITSRRLRFELGPRDADGLHRIRVGDTDLPTRASAFARPTLMGNRALWDRLFLPNTGPPLPADLASAKDLLTAHKDYRKFTSKILTPATEVPVEEARDFARELIYQTSKALPALADLEPEKELLPNVGETVDVAILDRTMGFTWLSDES